MTACKKHNLPKNYIQFAFVDYDASEIDSIWYVRYNIAGIFAQAQDSMLIVDGNATYTVKGDTTIVTPIDIAYRINDDYNVMLKNIYDNKRMYISNVQYSVERYTKGLFASGTSSGYSPVSSYVKDSLEVRVVNPTTTTQETVYLEN